MSTRQTAAPTRKYDVNIAAFQARCATSEYCIKLADVATLVSSTTVLISRAYAAVHIMKLVYVCV